MKTTIFALLLLTGIAQADVPNHWQPNRPASSGVVVGVTSCINSTKREHPEVMELLSGAGEVEYCGCLMDYYFSLGPLENATMKQLVDAKAEKAAKWCFDFAKANWPAKPKG